MRSRLVARLLVLALVCAPFAVAGQDAPTAEAEQRREWEQLVKHFKEPRSVNLITSGVWTLTHGGESREEVEALMKLLLLLADSSQKQDPAPLKETGGARGFKDKLAAFLDSKDDVVAGFAATMLGMAGDARYAPALAKLLDKKGPPEEEDELLGDKITSRGRVAVALSLLGAREYVPRFVAMLRSRNMYDRSGAAYALGLLRAKEHARELVALLRREEFVGDEAAVYALVEMGAAAEHADALAAVLRGKSESETVKAAAYALASLGARRYAKDIAALLGKPYLKGDAAKALAVMGATEYTDEIARMLGDENPLNRCDALLALGVLNATQYVPRVAKHLQDPTSFVEHFAAYALVLLGAGEYAAEIVPLAEPAHRHKSYLSASDFHPLVEEALVRHRTRFDESFRKMKAPADQKPQPKKSGGGWPRRPQVFKKKG